MGAFIRIRLSPCARLRKRNDDPNFVIPYEFEGFDHDYYPDYLVNVRTKDGKISSLSGCRPPVFAATSTLPVKRLGHTGWEIKSVRADAWSHSVRSA